jgi:hypothetical protein
MWNLSTMTFQSSHRKKKTASKAFLVRHPHPRLPLIYNHEHVWVWWCSQEATVSTGFVVFGPSPSAANFVSCLATCAPTQLRFFRSLIPCCACSITLLHYMLFFRISLEFLWVVFCWARNVFRVGMHLMMGDINMTFVWHIYRAHKT